MMYVFVEGWGKRGVNYTVYLCKIRALDIIEKLLSLIYQGINPQGNFQ